MNKILFKVVNEKGVFIIETHKNKTLKDVKYLNKNCSSILFYCINNEQIVQVSNSSDCNAILLHDGSFIVQKDEELLRMLFMRENSNIYIKEENVEDKCPSSDFSFLGSNASMEPERFIGSSRINSVLDKFKVTNSENILEDLESLNEEEPPICNSSVKYQYSSYAVPKVAKKPIKRVQKDKEDALKLLIEMGYETSPENLGLLERCSYDMEIFHDSLQRKSLEQ